MRGAVVVVYFQDWPGGVGEEDINPRYWAWHGTRSIHATNTNSFLHTSLSQSLSAIGHSLDISWVVVVVVVCVYRNDNTVLSYTAVTLILIFKGSLRPSIQPENLSSVVQSCMVWGPGCARAPLFYTLCVCAIWFLSPWELDPSVCLWCAWCAIPSTSRSVVSICWSRPVLGQVSFVSHVSLWIHQISWGVCPRSFQ